MRFERKIFFTYALLIIILVTALGIGFRFYMFHQNVKRTIENMQAMVEKNAQQMDEIVRPMKFITDYLLSDMDLLSAVSTMATVDKHTPQGMEFREEAKNNLRNALYTYTILENFYRVTYFNEKKDVFTSNFFVQGKDPGDVSFSSIPWLDAARKIRGKPFLSGAFTDPWAVEEEAIRVFALGRAMPGMGYLEVQQDINELDNIFSIKSISEMKAMAFNAEGDILYSDFSNELAAYYEDLSETLSSGVEELYNPIRKSEDIIAVITTDTTDIKIMQILDKRSIAESLTFMTFMTTLTALFIVIFSLAYIYIVAQRLTEPIKELKHHIDNTALENLEQQFEIDTSNNEIEALSNSYACFLSRLNDAVIKEKKLSLLHLQAQLDSLQAQINPHFLYNVLNVISYRGMESGDDEICEICDSLASMLRYSTGTKEQSSTIAEEVHHLKNYVYLLSTRYKQKLSVTIDIPSVIEDQMVPKLMLQPIVENAVNHGFKHIKRNMIIKVIGEKRNNWWYITIHDNGQGFSSDQSLLIRKKMEKLKKDIREHHGNLEMNIGGIGIINTYARLILFYQNQCQFTFHNTEPFGAEVVIGGIFNE